MPNTKAAGEDAEGMVVLVHQSTHPRACEHGEGTTSATGSIDEMIVVVDFAMRHDRTFAFLAASGRIRPTSRPTSKIPVRLAANASAARCCACVSRGRASVFIHPHISARAGDVRQMLADQCANSANR